MSFKRFFLRHAMGLYPPYLGAGIRVRVAPDLASCEVSMQLRWWNRNYFGTHFGGSLYSMCDPFFVLLLAERLGRDHVVWDKAATIRFRRPGRGRVTAHFAVSAEQVAEIRQQALTAARVEPTFRVEVRDEDGNLVAEVEKLLSIRRRDPPGAVSRPPAGS
jgi:acyl-coenzyme A thioesterase PaaI-like protein